ncbi:conserved hypothetical protein [Desulfamplus magnetovallimortis]|uniref:Glycosyl transferase family 1 domain-containing protein n=1 Tax=Desulfamplus magnetovallimortis TaxID=1246637 RepID=A0A1W1HG06_9BACT|nr:glycosyltransferase [Desulfamplus magnetovallimortis]SLM31410.1 conserved hypothetical protein [Desulfamplus magnetovallimortis]
MDSFDCIDNFIELTDSGNLFKYRCQTDDFYMALRKNLRAALVDLLFWRRPEVEQDRGIISIYELFSSRLELFESCALSDPDPFVAREASFFLAFLPFPGQWQWLEKVSEKYADHPEVIMFLKDEKDRIHRKIKKKNTKNFDLTHFCQIIAPPFSPPSNSEPVDLPCVTLKGVLRIFSIPYYFFSMPEILKKISKRYFIYVEPAAGINFRHEWLRVYAALDEPVLFGLSSPEDRQFIGSQKGVITTSLAHGDYLEPLSAVKGESHAENSFGEKLHDQRSSGQYDIVFNNTFDERERKRHSLMLELMENPLLKNITVLFIGRGSDKNIEAFRQEIRQKALEKRTKVVANIKRKDVPSWLARCKAGVHLALQENGCRAVYEYLRSDLPCIISSATAGMNMEIITPMTGVVARDSELAEAIAHVLDNLKKFQPAKWFEENSGSINSTRALNRVLKEHFSSTFKTTEKNGDSWQEIDGHSMQDIDEHSWQDIVPLTSSGFGRYARKEDYENFKEYFKELKNTIERFSINKI